jgi:glycosyltransferase involved in cell wall biosynthesis
LPLAAEVGLDREVAVQLAASERRALAAAALVIVTGPSTVGALASYGVDADRVALVQPGTDRAPLARGSLDRVTVHLVCVAAMSPGKGHEILVGALARLPMRNWRLTCAGNVERHPETTERVRAALTAAGLDDRVMLAGELDESALSRAYDSADGFVLATLHETYGMAVAEALARGLPVIASRTGAIAQLVEPDAGCVVAPGDAGALARALTGFLGDAGLRRRFAEGARRVRDRLPTWVDASAEMATALERFSRAIHVNGA